MFQNFNPNNFKLTMLSYRMFSEESCFQYLEAKHVEFRKACYLDESTPNAAYIIFEANRKIALNSLEELQKMINYLDRYEGVFKLYYPLYELHKALQLTEEHMLEYYG